MRIKSVEARWVHIPIPPERQHVSDFGRTRRSRDACAHRDRMRPRRLGRSQGASRQHGAEPGADRMINDEFAPLLKGEDPRDITRLWETLYSGTRGHYALREGRVFPVLGRRGITVSAISGVDCALWDILENRWASRSGGCSAAAAPRNAGLCLGRLGRSGQDRRAAPGLCRGRRVRCGQDARRHHRRRLPAIRPPGSRRRARRLARRSG